MSVPVAPEVQESDLETEERAEWSGASVNDLPDSAFAYIEPGGSKDGEGKTTPRDKRHLPYKNASGAVDKAHVKNALARLSHTQISEAAKASAHRKLVAAAKSVGVEVSDDEERAYSAETRAAPATTETARLWIPIRSTNAETREVEGVVSDEQVDMHGTIFDYDGMKGAMTRWLGNIREQHDAKKAVGRKVNVLFDDDKREITLRGRISKGAQDTWEKILDGTLGGFSVGAWNVRKTDRKVVEGKTVPVFKDFDLFEVSVVDVPSNLGAQASGLTIYRAATENGEDEYNADFDDYPLPDEPASDADAATAAALAAGIEERAAGDAAVETPAPAAEPAPAPTPQPRQILTGAQNRAEGGGDLAFTNVPLSPLSAEEIAALDAEAGVETSAEETRRAAALSLDAAMLKDNGPHEHTHTHEDDYSPLHVHAHDHTHLDGTTHGHNHMHNHAHHDHYGDDNHAHDHKHVHDHSHMFRVAAPDTSTVTCPQPGENPEGAETRGFVEPSGNVEFSAESGAGGANAEFDAEALSGGSCGCCDACSGAGCGCCENCLPIRADGPPPPKGKKGKAPAASADDDEEADKKGGDDNDEDDTDTSPGGKNASRAGKRISTDSQSKIHRSIQDLLELCNCQDCQDALATLNRSEGDEDEVTRTAQKLTRAVTRELAPLHATISQLRAVAARLTAVQGSDWSHVQEQLGEMRSSQEEALRLVRLIAEQEAPGSPVTRMADAKLTPVDKQMVVNPNATLDASQAPNRDLLAELEQIRAAGGFKTMDEQLTFATRLTQQAPILKR